MRRGFTTGSCAAAAAKAAVQLLLGGSRIDCVRILTPAGIPYRAELAVVRSGKNPIDGSDTMICAVRKDAGDDPDSTDQMLIYAEAGWIRDGQGRVCIEGGTGIGTVTRPGLDQPVGAAAINSVPRRMIEQEVRELLKRSKTADSIRIVIFAPQGAEIARKTFNPRLGIEGGISIIGTSGLVEPMSVQALIDTIRVELRQKKALGETVAVVSPGNYGREFIRKQYGYDLDRAVKCSNYIGETIDIAACLGFQKMVLIGHVGKLVKLSGGIMNTHSGEGDCRMELLAAAAIRAEAKRAVLKRILDSVTTEEAYGHLLAAGIQGQCFAYLMDRIEYYLEKRAGEMQIECIVYSNQYGLLGKTKGAEELLRENRRKEESAK